MMYRKIVHFDKLLWYIDMVIVVQSVEGWNEDRRGGRNDEPDDSQFWKSRLPDSNVVKNLYARFGFTDTDKLVDEDNGSVRGKLTRKGFEELTLSV